MKRLIALGVTIVLLVILYTRVDRDALRAGIAATRPDIFLAAIAMFIPQTLVQALRWRWLVGLFTPLGWGEAISLILASQTMNLVLPSKAGDTFLSTTIFLTSARAGAAIAAIARAAPTNRAKR